MKINNVNNEHLRLVNYFKKMKKNPKKNVSEHKQLEESEESEESYFEESDLEESEEYKTFYEEINKKYGFDKDGIHKVTETKYDLNVFDKDGIHKDEFLKLYNEIIKNGEFSENINKKNISSYDFKKNLLKIY